MANSNNFLLNPQLLKKAWEQMKQGVEIIKNLDDAMAELRKTSDEASSTYRAFQQEASKASVDLAVPASQMISAANEWKKMGYDLQEALELAKTTSMYANIGDSIGMADATKVLASTIQTFNMTADESVGIIDKISSLSKNYSISGKDLGDILNNSSSALASAHTSLDKSLALGAAMQEITRDSSSAASTLNVLSMRLGAAKEELEAAGESVHGMADSISDLRDRILTLTDTDGTGGFDIADDDGSIKDIYEQLCGIAEKWKSMSEANRSGLLELIAGKDHAQDVSALLSNWSNAENILLTALSSTGDAAEANQEYLDTLSGKLELLKAQYGELWQTTLSSDQIEFFIELSTNVLKAATDIGGLVPVVLGLGTAFTALKNAGKVIRFRDSECAPLMNAA